MIKNVTVELLSTHQILICHRNEQTFFPDSHNNFCSIFHHFHSYLTINSQTHTLPPTSHLHCCH